MKSVFSIILFISTGHFLMAQMRDPVPVVHLDTLRYIIQYELKYQEDSTSTRTMTEPMVLLAGDHISSFMSYNKLKRDSVSRSIQSQAEHNLFLTTYHHNNPMPKVLYTIYKNYPRGKTTFIQMIPPDFYHYTEAYNGFRWVIDTETKDAHGYTLQKATTYYGGRIWIAWFTSGLPINEGPYKFAGLPGLIVEIYDEKKHYHFVMTVFSKPEEAGFVDVRADLRSQEISRKAFHEAWMRLMQDPFQAGGIQADPREMEIRRRQSQRRNNPIELKAD